MRRLNVRTLLLFAFLLPAIAGAAELTCFQTAAPYSAELDIQSDMAIVYGVDASFAERVAGWRNAGYTAGMMTGIAWGGYESYYGSGDSFKKEEVQTRADGRLFMHNPGCGYNVPTPAYVEYIKRYVEPAVDADIRYVFLEEPEFWAESGWSEAFKKAWREYYGEAWQAPDSSPDAQYRASKLKYEMYFTALREVIGHIKERGRARGIEVECFVPTHSLINYAHWRIVSPESHLVDIPGLNGYVAQVWTGTARTRNIYRGESRERTFETAYFEYGQMLAMTRPTGLKVWFLADPVEDNPNRSWNDYKRNYLATVVASLMWPENYRYEVMPWPDRIFRGTYPKTDLDTQSGMREGIPADYATQILIVINALNDMNQPDVRFDTGTRGVGILVSDTMMFQRAAPAPGDSALGGFYGIALPLIKHGIPAEVVQLENANRAGALAPYKVLFLTYEHQKPLDPSYHEALARWVRNGGRLIYMDEGADPYHDVREWWNHSGTTKTKPYDDLFRKLGAAADAEKGFQTVGKGAACFVKANPSSLQSNPDGAEQVIRLTGEALTTLGESLRTQNYLRIRRGPYVVVAVLDESDSETPLDLEGMFIDLFDHRLSALSRVRVAPGERVLLYDVKWAEAQGMAPKVLAAGARIRGESLRDMEFSFTARGPAGTRAVARVSLPAAPKSAVSESAPVECSWDPDSRTALLSFMNGARDIRVSLRW